MSMQREYRHLFDAITLAGRKALELSVRGFDVYEKKDRSPVTTADLEANRILHDMQQKEFPDDGWLSEESPDDHARLGKSRVWIVDPIDGTRAYVNRLPEFCISAALIQKAFPVLGAIFVPSAEELFTAIRHEGLQLNEKPVDPAPLQTPLPVVAVSPGEMKRGRWKDLDGHVQFWPIHSIANALAMVATCRVHAALTIEPQNEWDLAAGALLIEEGGGAITDSTGQPLSFNQPTPRFPGVLAVSALADAPLTSRLQAAAESARSRSSHPMRNPL